MPEKNQLPLDTNVKIPAAVKAAAERAEQIHAEAYPDGNKPGDGATTGQLITSEGRGNPSNPPAETREATHGLAPTHPSAPERSEQRPVQSERQLPASGGQEGTRSGDGGSPGQGGNAEDWEQRYRSLRGRHEQMANENRALAQRMVGMESTLASLSGSSNTAANPDMRFGPGRPAAAPPARAPAPVDPNAFQLTPQELADYGDEFLGVVGKKAAQTILPMLDQMRAENEQLKQRLSQVGSSVAVNAQQSLEGFLDQQLPDWRRLNYDPNFLNWLGLTDPYSGARKQDLLSAAYERKDAARVLAFFQGFLADEAAVTPANPPQPNGGNGPPKVPLESFAAPGRAKMAAGPGAPAEKPTISRDQISAFYAQVAAGRYRGNEAEKNRLEGMIFEAQREGRIR